MITVHFIHFVHIVVSRASANSRGKYPCTSFQGVNVVASIQTYEVIARVSAMQAKVAVPRYNIIVNNFGGKNSS